MELEVLVSMEIVLKMKISTFVLIKLEYWQWFGLIELITSRLTQVTIQMAVK